MDLLTDTILERLAANGRENHDRQLASFEPIGSGQKLVDHAAALWYAPVSRPSRTAARTTATRCAPIGDHLIRRRFPMRVLPMPSTQPSARDEAIGRPLRCRQP